MPAAMVGKDKFEVEIMCTTKAQWTETLPNVVVASTTWTLTEASPRPAAMLLREKLGAEMMCTVPATHHVETLYKCHSCFMLPGVDRHLPQASCHAA
jgi:hypothetical protein